MKATTQLKVTREMVVHIRLEMTVDEMDSLVVLLKDQNRWPAWTLRSVLEQSLAKARDAYSSEHVIDKS